MFTEIKESLRQIYLEDARPWLAGFSRNPANGRPVRRRMNGRDSHGLLSIASRRRSYPIAPTPPTTATISVFALQAQFAFLGPT